MLHAGDEIYEVNDVEISQLSLDSIVSLLVGCATKYDHFAFLFIY